MRDVRQSTAAAASSDPMIRLLLLLRRLSVVLLGLVGHGQRTYDVRARLFAGRAADIADDGDIVLAGETDPAQIAIAPVTSPRGRVVAI
jgi:hypothetical protein